MNHSLERASPRILTRTSEKTPVHCDLAPLEPIGINLAPYTPSGLLLTPNHPHTITPPVAVSTHRSSLPSSSRNLLPLHSPHPSSPVNMVIPASARDYITFYQHRFDSRRFAAIPEDRSGEPGNHEDRDTAWLSRWRHVPCQERVPRDMFSDLEWVRCAGEVAFVDSLRQILRNLSDSDRSREQTVFRRHLCPWPQPFCNMYWLHRYRWGEDAQRDARLRNRRGANGDHAPVMSGWHNTEMHQMPVRTRQDLYSEQPVWWQHFEPHPALCIPTPTTLAYVGSETITNRHGLMRVVWSIALSEHIPNCFWGWLEAARWGLHNFAHRSTDEGFFASDAERRFRGRMFHLSDRLLSYFREAGIPWLVEGSDVSAGVAERALHRMQWYFQHHTTEYWATYEWEDDMFHSERMPRQVAAPTPPSQGAPSGYDQPSESHQDIHKRRRTESGWVAAIEDARARSVEPPPAPSQRVYPKLVPSTPPLIPSAVGARQPAAAIAPPGPSAALLLRSRPVEPRQTAATAAPTTDMFAIPQKNSLPSKRSADNAGTSCPTR